MSLCSLLLEFELNTTEDDTLKLKLWFAKFCRVRHCPVCQWRRSLCWKAKMYNVLPQIVEKYPTHRWLFLNINLARHFSAVYLCDRANKTHAEKYIARQLSRVSNICYSSKTFAKITGIIASMFTRGGVVIKITTPLLFELNCWGTSMLSGLLSC